MKILVCLLSEQHVPNLLSVHHFKPERLVLVESEGMRRRGATENFLAALRFGCLGYDGRCDVAPLADENSLTAISECLQGLVEQHPDATWIVNLTGGTKPMSIGAYDLFRARPAKLIYTPIDRPNLLLDFSGGTSEICNYRPRVREFLAGYGFEYSQRPGAVQARENASRLRWNVSRTIVQHSRGRAIVAPSFFEYLNDTKKGRPLELQPGHLRANHTELSESLQQAFSLSKAGGSLVGVVDYETARFLTGGWLETFLWGLLDRHADALGLWDVHLGLQLRAIGRAHGNEYDVAFMKDYALCGIECKSGQQADDPKFNVLYKVEATVRQFRALRVRSFVATTADRILDTKTETVKKHLAERAELYNCRIVTRMELERLAAEADSAEIVQSVLFPASR